MAVCINFKAVIRKAGVFEILLRLKKWSEGWYLFDLCA